MESTDQPFAALHETHSGVVFLLGDRVYKAKKPIRTEFLDFRSRDARRAVCAREVELNRRLAPDVYLGVVELPDPETAEGEPLVVMRRMPEDARLSTLVRGDDVADRIDAIADTVAHFHARALRGPDIAAEGTAAAVRRRWCNNIRETRALDQHVLDDDRLVALERRVLRYLDGREALFGERIAAGRIVDGHGDLLADDIFWLADGPRILDCLEFDDRLRYLDELDDIACLAMDLEFLDRPDLAARLFDRYAETAGDPAPASLRHQYVAYRAFMRAKVDCVRYLQGRAESADDALRHTALAEEHLARGAVRLAIVGGLPATGKSTVARALATEVGAELVSSDAIRRELFAAERDTDPDPGFGRGRYSADATARVYETLLDRARRALDRGMSVVLDASWTDARWRERAAAVANASIADLVPLECVAPPDVTERRLHARAEVGGDHDSEATPDIARAMSLQTDPWPEATEVDTGGPAPQALATAIERWESPHRP
ncbi:aminoglycoside phosphotransferase family enzyme/predicted kinase [Rhodococcus sp. LBL1]|nr:aminoglycoside phosphotransferase family enzyme/predicted kinase [Rhodococcus sp. LBL1]MDH6684444.1 aminoglycoside phosphotransferase family enzyme/predicted kinase [Rhodococcus sp. LBL2]